MRWIIGILAVVLLPSVAWSLGPKVTIEKCQLDWVAPVASNLAGYRVYLSKTAGVYDFTKPVSSPTSVDLKSLCSRFGPLTVGQYFLVMRSIDTRNNESANSLETPFEIVPPPDTTPPPPPTGLVIRNLP